MTLLVDYGSPLITLLLLVAVGLDLRPEDFRRARIQPRLVALGVLVPPLLLPAFAVALIRLFEPPPLVAGGLLLLACCPAGGISNIYSYLAGASTALAVTLTAVSCALAAVTMPLVALALASAWGQRSPYAVPAGALFAQVVPLLAVPIGAGMAVRVRWPAAAARLRPLFQHLSFLLLALLLGIAVSGGFGTVSLDLVRSACVVAFAFTTGAFLLGTFVASVARADWADRFTLSAEFATRNAAIASAVALSIAGLAELTLFVGLYLACEIPLLMLAAVAYRRFRGATSHGGASGSVQEPPH